MLVVRTCVEGVLLDKQQMKHVPREQNFAARQALPKMCSILGEVLWTSIYFSFCRNSLTLELWLSKAFYHFLEIVIDIKPIMDISAMSR